jgi:hypothetical protein
MGFLGIGKKNKNDQDNSFDEALSKVDTSGMTKMQKMAFSFFKKLPKKKQEEVMRKAMNPQAIQKDKDKIIKQLNEAVKSGEMSKQEAEMVKSRLGLR